MKKPDMEKIYTEYPMITAGTDTGVSIDLGSNGLGLTQQRESKKHHRNYCVVNAAAGDEK